MDMKKKFLGLTPDRNIALGVYEEAVNFALENNENINNVAITGVYGAGKSSMLETYENKHPDKKFLHVSLAHFENITDEQSVNENEKKKLELILEGKIINQLVHLIPQEKIPLAKFATKRETDNKKIEKYTCWGIAFLMLSIYLAKYELLKQLIDNMADGYFYKKIISLTQPETVVISAAIWFMLLAALIYQIVKRQMNKQLFQKINLKGNGVEAELFSKEDDSYFDKYLDEILYILEESGEDAIVFEDMDRYNNTLIYEKLRELNVLVNQRIAMKNSKKHICFFYLLKDDIFLNKERTKFFDFIIPIVPVANAGNSLDFFLKYFRQSEMGEAFEKQFLYDLSLYVDDLRVLRNICNEYVVYHTKLQEKSTELDVNKLLAIITYKNLFPKDFAELQVSQGYVYQLFAYKEKYIDDIKNGFLNEIQNLQTEIRNIETDVCNDKNELDALFFSYSERIKINDKEEDEFPKRSECIAAIKANSYNVMAWDTYYRRWKTVNIKSTFDNLLDNEEYAVRRQLIEEKTQTAIHQRQMQIHKKQEEYSAIGEACLKDVISSGNENEIFLIDDKEYKEIKENTYFDLIKYLISYGYIDESYRDYMSFFYGESISRNDKIFLRSVTDKHPKDFKYMLDDPQTIISRLRMTDIEKVECLNYNLLDYLLEHREQYAEQIKSFMKGLKKREPKEFVNNYLIRERNIPMFTQCFNNYWEGACTWIIGCDEIEEKATRAYIKATLTNTGIDKLRIYNEDDIICNYIKTNRQFLVMENSNHLKMVTGIKELGILFYNIEDDMLDPLLLDEICKENCYVINRCMIDIFLKHIYELNMNGRSDELTTILSGQTSLAERIENNLSDYVKMRIDEKEVMNESEQTILLVLNAKNVDLTLKRKYISLQSKKISDINSVEPTDLWDALLPDHIKITVKNVFDYYYCSGNGMDQSLIRTLNDYIDLKNSDFKKVNQEYGENAKKDFFISIIGSNEINNNKYEKILKAVGMTCTEMADNEIRTDKMEILIKTKIMTMTLKNLHFLRDDYGKLVWMFIITNPVEYFEIMTPEEWDDRELRKLYEWYPQEQREICDKIYEIAKQDFNEIIQECKSLHPQLINRLLDCIEFTIAQKKTLLANAVQTNKISIEEVKKRLYELGMEQVISAFEGKRPTVEVVEENRILLDSFQIKNWISKFERDKNKRGVYRIVGKKAKGMSSREN